jgi:hypothetical protein
LITFDRSLPSPARLCESRQSRPHESVTSERLGAIAPRSNLPLIKRRSKAERGSNLDYLFESCGRSFSPTKFVTVKMKNALNILHGRDEVRPLFSEKAIEVLT